MLSKALNSAAPYTLAVHLAGARGAAGYLKWVPASGAHSSKALLCLGNALAGNLVRSIGRRAIPDPPAGAFGDDGFTSTAELPKDAQRYHKYRQALLDLVAFGRQHEHLFFAGLVAASSSEKHRLEVERLLAPSAPPSK